MIPTVYRVWQTTLFVCSPFYGDSLGVPGVQQSKDGGNYQCCLLREKVVKK